MHIIAFIIVVWLLWKLISNMHVANQLRAIELARKLHNDDPHRTFKALHKGMTPAEWDAHVDAEDERIASQMDRDHRARQERIEPTL